MLEPTSSGVDSADAQRLSHSPWVRLGAPSELADGRRRPVTTSFLKFVAAGAVWGTVAVPFHLLMYRGFLPPQALDPLGVVRIVVDAPFITAAGVMTLLGRPSPSLAEVGLASVASGVAVGAVVEAVGLVMRRRP